MTDENSYTPSPELAKLREDKAQIEAEIDEALREKEELNHQIKRAENRMDYLKKGERNRRTHRLCIKGGVIESLAPGLTDFSEQEFYDLMEMIFSLPQVESLVQGKINHRKQEDANG